MKIALLTSARSGSTSLFHLFEEILKPKRYVCISEPFNSFWRNPTGLKLYDTSFFEKKENVFIKTFVSDLQRPIEFKDDEESYWDWFFTYFDKVIILDRKDKELQSESLTYHLKNKDFYSWQRKQFYDLSKIEKEEIENSRKILIRDSEKKHVFSQKGYPIFYFEDLFIDKNVDTISNLFSYLNLDLRNDLIQKYIISDSFKIRIDNTKERFKSII
jgi:hypothetical protein